MITAKEVKGVIAAIATPFHADESLDLEGLKILVHYLIDGGVDGIMAVGGTGEFPSGFPAGGPDAGFASGL